MSDDEAQIAKVMAITGIDRPGAERAAVAGKAMAEKMIAAYRRSGESHACIKCGFAPDAAVSARWEFVLDKRIESANNRTVNAGASRWRYAKQRDEWMLWVRSGVLKARLLRARPSSKRRVTVTRRYAGRCRSIDRDNVQAGVKALVDALVREGVVHDDDAAHLELHVLQEQVERNETHVLVEELA